MRAKFFYGQVEVEVEKHDFSRIIKSTFVAQNCRLKHLEFLSFHEKTLFFLFTFWAVSIMQKKYSPFLEMFYYRIILYGVVRLIARLKLNYLQNSLQIYFMKLLLKIYSQPCEFSELIALIKERIPLD